MLTLLFTRSGTCYNFVESVVLGGVALIRRLRDHLRSLPGDRLLYAGGGRTFRRTFDDIVAHLRFPCNPLYKPYSIRRGAATEFFRAAGSLSRTAVRGRWRNEKTCRIYVNESMSMLGDIRHSSRCRDHLEHFAGVAERFFGEDVVSSDNLLEVDGSWRFVLGLLDWWIEVVFFYLTSGWQCAP